LWQGSAFYSLYEPLQAQNHCYFFSASTSMKIIFMARILVRGLRTFQVAFLHPREIRADVLAEFLLN